jgi:N6-adenosine-specific RNA methylase IME4/ParB-like chromosome segregation protein Spo0J
MPDLPIDSIVVESRFRKNLGDLRPLMKSIREVGLIHPIVVSPQGTLIAGRRRLEAFKKLGLKSIPCRVVDLENVLQAEHDENVVRMDFLPSEAVAIKKALEPLEREKAKKRMADGGRGVNLTPLDTGKSRDRLAAHVGMSFLTLQRASEIVEAAEEQPEKYSDLVEEMDRTGRIAGVHKKLRVRQETSRLETESLCPPRGSQFRVIVADPPWPFQKRHQDPSKRNKTPYPTMSLDEIKALTVAELAAEDSILWLWNTNAHLPDAFEVIRSWDFTYKTTLTWVKNRMGTGDWLRGQTEHCLMAVRGRPTVNLTNQTTVINAPTREHSTKPDEFYGMVESLCPGNKLELFARRPREGWQTNGILITAK